MSMTTNNVSPGQPSSTDSRRFGTTFAERGAAFIGVAFGIGLAVLLAANTDGADSVAGPLGPIAFGAVYGLPGLLALLGTRRRPALPFASGLIAPLLAFTAMSGVALPMFIPTGMAFVAYGRRAREVRGLVFHPAVALVCFLLAVASFSAMFLNEDPRCVTGPNFSSCSSDVVTAVEAALAIAGVTLTLVAGWLLSRPRIAI